MAFATNTTSPSIPKESCLLTIPTWNGISAPPGIVRLGFATWSAGPSSVGDTEQENGPVTMLTAFLPLWISGQDHPPESFLAPGPAFPARYQKAFFVGDWSYGIIYAVHLKPAGASYTGVAERFASASPLAVTDMVIHPKDGALYFTTGGRGSQSKLYRIVYVGKESTAPVKWQPEPFKEMRDLRRKLEALHHPNAKDAVKIAWPYLGHDDRHIRFAARIAVEHQPVQQWQELALSEKNDRSRVHAMIALARHGAKEIQPKMLAALDRVDWKGLTSEQKLELLRAYALTFARLGRPDEDTIERLSRRFDSVYPDRAPNVNRELCRLLCYFNADNVVRKTLDLLENAPTQEEQIHYAYCLRQVTNGWDDSLRKRYFSWFNKSAGYRGGASFEGFLRNIRADALKRVDEKSKRALGKLADPDFHLSREPVATEPRKVVKKWTVDELVPLLTKKQSGFDFNRGRRMFAIAGCFKCHRFAGDGGAVGPDLTGVGGRFSPRDILEAIIEPSKVISDQYQSTVFTLKSGRVVVGYVANMSRDNIAVVENMLEPGKFTNINANDVEEKAPSPISMMPNNLVDILTADEILDLVAYLRSGGNPDHPLFKK